MISYYERYLRGDHAAVWADLRALGAIPDSLAEDAAAVADETMVRVAQHVARIAAALPELGWVGSDGLVPAHQPPTEDDDDLVDALLYKIGGLPLALEACLRRVGEVWFAGDCDALELTYHQQPAPRGDPPGPQYPDPLCVSNAYSLSYEWQRSTDPNALTFAIAPDERLKANVSGRTHDIELPSTTADPVLLGVAGRPGITLVEYLRESVAWGGFPGFSFAPELAPAALITLQTTPDF